VGKPIHKINVCTEESCQNSGVGQRRLEIKSSTADRLCNRGILFRFQGRMYVGTHALRLIFMEYFFMYKDMFKFKNVSLSAR
jgi:hypothetical protein